MPRRLTFSRRALTAARWPVGVLKTGWDYLWRTTPMDRRDEDGTVDDDMPPPLPRDVDLSDHQGIEDGYGPLMHRCYIARIKDAELSAKELIDKFAGVPNRAAPKALGSFVK